MSLSYSTFTTPNGESLRWAKGPVPAHSKGTIFILLGWAEWLEKYAEIAEEWHNRQYETVILEWRDQGGSSRFLADKQASWLPTLDLHITDLNAFYKKHIALQKGPIILFAHSMGAHIGLRWWMEYGHRDDNIKKLILCSIMQDINSDPFPLPVAKAIARSACAMGLSQEYAPGCKDYDQAAQEFEVNRITHNRARFDAMMKYLRENPCHKVGGITFGWLKAVFDSTEYLENALHQGVPQGTFLVLGSSFDTLVNTAGIKRIAALLPHATTHYFENAHHELLQETDEIRTRVWEAIDRFLND